MIWVLARDVDGRQVYWTGIAENGRATWSPWWSDAHHFTTASSALECTRTHIQLDNSIEWRIVQITARCERTS